MPRQSETATEENKESGSHAPPELGKVGEKPVGTKGIIMIMAYLMLLSVLILSGIVKLWPLTDSESVKSAGEAGSILNEEVRMFLIVAMAGALGSLVHALRSLYWYVGNRALVRSWLPKYILLPFVGATLGLVFYFVIRGGFFSPQATSEEISP